MQIIHPMFPYYNIPPTQKQEEVQKKCNMKDIILQNNPGSPPYYGATAGVYMHINWFFPSF